jgi:hypothetical protein
MGDENSSLQSAMTLEQFCRALAAHLLLASHPDLLHSVMAPETAEQTAQFIYCFALGEQVPRPKPITADHS